MFALYLSADWSKGMELRWLEWILWMPLMEWRFGASNMTLQAHTAWSWRSKLLATFLRNCAGIEGNRRTCNSEECGGVQMTLHRMHLFRRIVTLNKKYELARCRYE